ncbi:MULTISPECIES: collagenase [unclassified Streptomyces]|uniref:collagenase n=1 Tax=unclassified Streptomyces TaxID=2593676 RepID=UPI000DC7A850|nr:MULTISPECIES: collagenase [unclassified Streptomyces]AWZ06022.1 collagenase [Streptomyces sp. ICC4]AWZ13122.1 collagenase [Streptomyces sp. ICC1]
MFQHRAVRTSLLSAAVAVTLLATAGQAVTQAAETGAGAKAAGAAAQAPGATAPDTFAAGAQGANPFDEVDHLADAPKTDPAPAPAPGGQAVTDGQVPGPVTKPAAASTAKSGKLAAAAQGLASGVPCTLDGITNLSPEQFADFLADPAVTAGSGGCLSGLIWTWDARLAPVMSDAHVQAVSRRISTLAAAHDGRNSSHLEEMFTYLHAVAYHDFSRTEIDVTDAPTVDAMRRAVADFGSAARTFDATASNARTLREALYAASAPGLRQHQLGLITKVLATMDPSHPATHLDTAWAGAALAALSVNYLGVNNQDAAFRAAAAGDPAYRAVFKNFATYAHLKGATNAWVARDALAEYGRFGQIPSLRDAITADLGALLGPVRSTFGDGSEQWAKVVSWLNYYQACKPYGVCKEDIERQLFPNTFTYDNGAIKVRTGLDRATVDQLYYASKQVKTQFHRVLGTEQPLAGDANATLNIVLYASRADYVGYHPVLTGYGTNNGGIYIENGATFYTYQRRVPQDSSLTLEELFRHEYTHYLNGRFAVPGSFGQGPWYQNDRTTAMDEGTAEFFDGATRDNGIAVRKSLVRGIVNDTAGGGPRMTVDQLLHATYDGDGFRFYNYAGTFFEFLWTEHPSVLKEMYGLLRADDPAGYDAWRTRLGQDSYLQRDYDRFLDAQIAKLDQLYVPNTSFTPNGLLRDAALADVKSAFATATYSNPDCVENGDPGKRRFTCTGKITANLTKWRSDDQNFKDMSETVDYFLLDRAGAASNNLADMNCSFGPVEIWTNHVAGTSSYSCEGPLRS